MNTALIGIEVMVLIFVMTMTLTNIILPLLRQKRAGQYILEIGPSWHKSKEGTPTMGGLAPLIAVLIGVSFFICYFRYANTRLDLTPLILTLLFALGNALVGVFDDATKLKKKSNGGFTPWQKLALQFTIATAYAVLSVRYGMVDTTMRIPFADITFPLGFLWYPFAVLLLVWIVNCGNLTDGIDGLASSVGCIIGAGFLLIATVMSSISLALCSASLIGATLGFFIFNKHPAKIFMGDTGSLFFGALAVGCAFICGNPLVIIPLGIVYTIEGLSVILQVFYFKLTHGKRLFRMAPFHHHLEKCGWSEWKIVILFLLITCGAVLAVYRGISL